MAFWGVEVKPGKPFTHSFDRARGRLRISQATLGIGSATNKSIVQCNVGNKSPVFLCALLPDKTESCHLDLEFEEADEILFSVIGPRSVHLTGYYLGSCHHSDLNDETESYGEDIANTDTDESIHGSKEDEYEDSFIDDGGDPEVFPPSPISNDDVSDEEMLANKKPTERRGIHKRLKKKYRSIESDDDNDLQPKIAVNNNKGVSGLESEDEDNFPISSLHKSQTAEAGKKYDREMGKSVGKKVEDDVTHIIETIAEDNVVMDTPPDRGMNMPSRPLLPSDGLVLENDLELKKETEERPEKGESLKTDGITCHDTLEVDKAQSIAGKADDISQNLCIKIGHGQKSAADKGSDQPGHSTLPFDDVDLEKHTKAKKKRKRTKGGKTFEDDTDNHGIALANDKALQDTMEDKKPATDKLDDSLLPSTEAASGNGAKPKKRRKKCATEGTSIESGADCNHVSEYGKSNENKGGDGRIGKDLYMRSEEEKLPCNENAEIDYNQVNNGDQSKDKKTKRKKKSDLQKNEGNTDINFPSLLVEIKNKVITVCKDNNVEAKSSHANVLSNGLTVEELELGKPDGKVATPGKKVKVHYIGKLKEKGQIFDSNIGKAPFKFRLGDEDVIQGWNIGLDGMRVGGKRRLIIPPSMGYGSLGAGENVPPNSWLVYEVDLVGVR